MMFIIKLKITQAVRKVVHSKQFLGVLSLVIGISWTFVVTFSHFEGANIMRFVRESVAESIKEISDRIRPDWTTPCEKEKGCETITIINPAYASGIPKEETKIELPKEEPQAVKDPKATLQRIAKEQGIDWKILMGICMEESRGCTPGEIGDSGASLGWFQINKPEERGISNEQAHNLEFSARWTAERLKRYAAIGGWDYAIRKHNGNADYNFGSWKKSFEQTERYLARVKINIEKL